jgi:Flp pilus assembly protein TadG
MIRNRRRGSSTIEMALVGIPIIFTLISIFEMSRGMWIYNTLAYSVKVGVRLASVHGENCINNPPGVTNDCKMTIALLAKAIKDAGVGLDPDKTLLTFNANNGDITSCFITACLSQNTQWPPSTSSENQVGKQIRIDIKTPFHSAIAMIFPGASPVSFAQVNLGASSEDIVQF